MNWLIAVGLFTAALAMTLIARPAAWGLERLGHAADPSTNVIMLPWQTRL